MKAYSISMLAERFIDELSEGEFPPMRVATAQTAATVPTMIRFLKEDFLFSII